MILVAAGTGSRFGRRIPKQFTPLAGKPILLWSLEVFASLGGINEIVVVAPARYLARVRKLAAVNMSKATIRVVAGGRLRQDSVLKGLLALERPPRVVLVHDAARPLITARFVRSLLRLARSRSALIPALPIAETVKQEGRRGVVAGTVPRKGLWVAQTPQVFHYDLLYNAHMRAKTDRFRGTDDASLVERLGVRVHLAPGDPVNLKVTVPSDLKTAEWRIRGSK
ncbi:MAG: 2-C-methyl-D-erythritol 4-phosphate cytidylyltransferase [Ignavibacteria bacterium]|nr:2-C-methyl-D-erythritol 4-phosphate cytidylyltransferase [Ignavibacteria bacterium]